MRLMRPALAAPDALCPLLRRLCRMLLRLLLSLPSQLS
jgi:hypothetical protein